MCHKRHDNAIPFHTLAKKAAIYVQHMAVQPAVLRSAQAHMFDPHSHTHALNTATTGTEAGCNFCSLST